MRRIAIILCCICVIAAQSQQADSLRLIGEALISRQFEHLVGIEENVPDVSELTLTLEEYLEKPLNLNTASKNELKSLQLLDEIQIKNLLDYRKKYGEFHSIFELNVIDGYGRNTIEKIRPFVTVSAISEDNNKSNLFIGKHEVLIRSNRKMLEQAGYKEPAPVYRGDPLCVLLRYRYKVPGRISLGIITEKDPGETYFDMDYGPDFMSFHAFYKGNGILKAVVAGDYHARFGQGLVLWTGLSFGGGNDPSSIKRYATAVSPNTSASENSFLRGGAMTFGIDNMKLTLLYSANKTDANIEYEDSSHSETYISSFPSSGYHRTPAEMEDRKSLNVQHLGANTNYEGNRFQIGSSFCYSRYGIRIFTGTQADDKYSFKGRENMAWGMDLNVLLRRTNIFGEVAMSKNLGWAALFGISHTTDNGSLLSLQIREYRKEYQNLMAQANGRRDQNNNERGIRMMLEFPLIKKWTFSASWDYYKYPWLTYRNISPVRGQDLRSGILYSGYSSASFSASYRFRQNSLGSGVYNSWTDQQVWQIKHEIKVKASFELSPSFSARLQTAYVVIRRAEEGFKSAGACLATDIHYHPPIFPLKIVWRYSVFNTDDYESRIYFYENDVLYSSSMPACYGRGTRCFLLFKYSPFSFLDTWFRFSLTVYNDRTTISNGHDEIQGNKLPEMKVQLRLKL